MISMKNTRIMFAFIVLLVLFVIGGVQLNNTLERKRIINAYNEVVKQEINIFNISMSYDQAWANTCQELNKDALKEQAECLKDVASKVSTFYGALMVAVAAESVLMQFDDQALRQAAIDALYRGKMQIHLSSVRIHEAAQALNAFPELNDELSLRYMGRDEINSLYDTIERQEIALYHPSLVQSQAQWRQQHSIW